MDTQSAQHTGLVLILIMNRVNKLYSKWSDSKIWCKCPILRWKGQWKDAYRVTFGHREDIYFVCLSLSFPISSTLLENKINVDWSTNLIFKPLLGWEHAAPLLYVTFEISLSSLFIYIVWWIHKLCRQCKTSTYKIFLWVPSPYKGGFCWVHLTASIKLVTIQSWIQTKFN